MDPGDSAIEPAQLIANLRAAGVGLVVVVHLPHPGRSADRPSQEAALRASGVARLLSHGDAVTVWALGRTRAAVDAGAPRTAGQP